MKIASWNVNSLRVRLPHVLDWLQENQPDILALQETKMTDDQFPVDDIREAGYEVSYSGQKTYNGVAIISKLPQQEVIADIQTLDDPQRRILAATIGGVRLLNLYVVNGQEVGSEKYSWKLEWLDKVSVYIEHQLKQYDKLVVVGDFNIAPADEDTWDPEVWRDRILCSVPERDALKRITNMGLADSFRLFDQEPESFSWWDYRAAGFRRNHGLRIDLILASKGMQPLCTASYIDKAPRKLERPSDHAPVVAEFSL
jgi:exodeoxyribonuclease-3